MSIKLISEEVPQTSLDINALTEKTTPVNADITVLEDSADTFAKKKLSFTNLKAFLKTYFDTLYPAETTTSEGALINSATSKTTPVDADYIGLMDSAASNVLKKLSWANLKATAKTYFDTLYGTIASVSAKVDKETLTDNAIVRADGTAGDVQNSGITIDDSNNIILPTTAAGATTGIIYKGTTRFIHNFRPTGASAGNFFAGEAAGNLTMTFSSGFDAWGNTGIGYSALSGLTTGYSNVALGYLAGSGITTGTKNFALGASSLTKVTTGNTNTAVGAGSAANTTGSFNVMVGGDCGKGVSGTSTYGNTTAIGFNAGVALTTGSNNILLGYQAGNVITTGANNIIIGYDIDPSGATVSNEINIGNRIFAGMTGSPESVITAGIGSLYLRSDGGANTTLYIKESGTGNTGWIAK